MKMRLVVRFFLRWIVLATILLESCDSWQKDISEIAPSSKVPSTFEKVKAIADLSQAVDAFVYSRDTIISILSELDSFTVFMPTNQAIADFLSKTPNYSTVADIGGNYSENPPPSGKAPLGDRRLINLLRFHIIPSRVLFLPNNDSQGRDSLKTGIYPTLRAGASLRVLANHAHDIKIINTTSATFSDTARVIVSKSNIIGRNKVVVHAIDKVLFPGGSVNTNIQSLLQLYGYDSLYRILENRPQIFNVLAGVQSGATFFAPSNLAVTRFMLAYQIPSIDSIAPIMWRKFRKTETDTVYTTAKGTNVLIEILRMHLLADINNAITMEKFLQDLQTEYAVFPLQQATVGLPPAPFLTINRGLNTVFVGDNRARITHPNLRASNGIIHGIDKVILPPDFLQIR
ncbi:MAG: fasciclin domain-containing protein [Cytophagales bacterium]|nr:fasciclin domain-containing protein [Cytophagales bacterium]MDW8383348.1 fasciclin domain-containing protein [Flammeovirgaceae bacterium]